MYKHVSLILHFLADNDIGQPETWTKTSFFVRVPDKETRVSKAVETYIKDLDIAGIRNPQAIGYTDSPPTGIYSHVMNEQGEYLAPKAR